MEIGKTLYVQNRNEWRSWLEIYYCKETDIWLVYYKKHTNQPSIPYNDAVEEALCFGWIDSIMKKLDDDRMVQRYSPRRKNSPLSELNKERVRRMIAVGKMTEVGLERIIKHIQYTRDGKPEPIPFQIPGDIINILKKDPEVWKNYCAFPDYYKNIRIGFIEGGRSRPEVFKQRLDYFIKMTKKNKRFGMIQ